MAVRRLSADRARRIALSAQGFCRPRPSGEADIRHLRQVIHRLGLLQLDFVNVLVPAHYLVLYSRLGAYPRDRLNRLVYQRREFTEQWAHEASIVPMELWPLLEYRRQDYRPWPNSPIMKIKGKSKYLTQIIDLMQNSGPVTSNDLPPVKGPVRKQGDWHRSVPRWALECHFGSGQLAVVDRLPNFQRVYDLPHRVIDRQHLDNPVPREAAQRELLRRASVAYGIATMRDLADYYRMSPREAAPRVAELLESGELESVEVEGWDEPGLLSSAARSPRGVTCAALLSPFDPLVWFRPRAERLFDFHYRIEIYVPAAKRRWGYYVLPFLLDDRIVARVDLKADRRNGTLLVNSAHPEEGIERDRVAAHLAGELRSLANWLGLDTIRVGRKGGLARELGGAVRTL